MEASVNDESITFSRPARAPNSQVPRAVQAMKEARQQESNGTWASPKTEISVEGELKTRIEHDIALAQAVMLDIGYAPNAAVSRLPKIEEVHFYKTTQHDNSVSGNVPHEGGRLVIELSPEVSEENWNRIGPFLTHELGHYPAKRVYGPGTEENSDARLISIGLDRRKRYVGIMGTQYFQPDADAAYMNGVLREPLADIFGYYCTEKRNDGTAYHAQTYYRETAFVVTLLQQLAEIRGTKFFEEFARMYKSFNDGDYDYFVTIRDDFANHWEKNGSTNEESVKMATTFVSNLNSVQTRGGMDRVKTEVKGAPEGIHLTSFYSGGQITNIASEAGFKTRYLESVKAICNNGLVLDNAVTVMTRNVDR